MIPVQNGSNSKQTPRSAAALVIGVGQYAHGAGIRPLEFSVNDAWAIASTLTNPQVCRFPKEQVKVLVDADATLGNVKNHLRDWLPQHATGRDLVVLFFAGHGACIKNVGDVSESVLYLHDTLPDVSSTSLSMKLVNEALERLEVGARVVLLDCCDAGGFVLNPRADSVLRPRGQAIDPISLVGESGRGNCLLAACEAGQPSVESSELRHGLFTHFLIDGLQGRAGVDNDGRVGVDALFAYTAKAVGREAKRHGFLQKPWQHIIGTGGIYLSEPHLEKSSECFESSATSIGESEDIVDAAIRLSETADVETIASCLQTIGRASSIRGLPVVLRAMLHDSPRLQQKATNAWQAIGWAAISNEFVRWSQQDQGADLLLAVRVLSRIEFNADVLQVLRRMAVAAKGEARRQAHLVIEQKMVRLDQDRIVSIFANRSPHYEIEKGLGQGLFAASYAARHRISGSELVVRVLRPEHTRSLGTADAFLDLGRRSYDMVHQNLVVTRDCGAISDESLYYVVRSHIRGLTLRTILAEKGALEFSQAFKIVRALLGALAVVHSFGRAHMAVKPSNIFVSDGNRITLGDLSLPPTLAFESRDRLVYDFAYAAPEAFGPPDAIGCSADFYSLGCVVYEILCGRTPFIADDAAELIVQHRRDAARPLSQLVPGMPIVADNLLKHLLQKDPKRRPKNTEDIEAQLDQWESMMKKGSPVTNASVMIASPTMVEHLEYSILLAAPLVQTEPTEMPQTVRRPVYWEAQTRALTTTEEIAVNDLDDGPEDCDAPRSGVILHGHQHQYRLIEVISSGGMGQVWRADILTKSGAPVDPPLTVAVKFMLNDSQAGESRAARERFEREIKVLEDLRGFRGIVKIDDWGHFSSGCIFKVMEYLKDPTLEKLIESNINGLPQLTAVQIVLEILMILEPIHRQKFIHRDLKPKNIVVSTDPLNVRILDFGLAKPFEEGSGNYKKVTQKTDGGKKLMGSVHYIAPEQFQRQAGQVIDERTDLYSVGIILYELLSGAPPFRGVHIEDILKQHLEKLADPLIHDIDGRRISSRLQNVLRKALSKKQSERYLSAEEFKNELYEVVHDLNRSQRPRKDISKDYKLLRKIGVGASGLVWEGERTSDGYRVALKLAHENIESDWHEEMILNETERVFDHDNIVKLVDAGMFENKICVVMELMDKITVEDLIQQYRVTGFPEAMFYDIVNDVCLGLYHAHSRNVMHRDVKPANFLRSIDGRTKVGDFGLARRFERGGGSKATSMVGTQAYMAPEQFNLKERIDHRADIYSLGVVMYEMLSGRLPFNEPLQVQHLMSDPEPFEARGEFGNPDELGRLIERCLQKVRDKRPQTMKEVAQELSRIRKLEPQKTPRKPLEMHTTTDIFHRNITMRVASMESEKAVADLSSYELKPHFDGWRLSNVAGVLWKILLVAGVWKLVDYVLRQLS